MVSAIKRFLLTHEPFKPQHVGMLGRFMYFRQYLSAFVPIKSVHTVFDAGCGTGFYSEYLATLLPQAKVLGVDIVAKSDWGRSALPNLSFETLDLTQYAYQDEHDLIISIDSLEHIPNNTDVLKRFATGLKKGGYLYLAVPCDDTNVSFFPESWFAKFHEWEEDEHIGEEHTLSQLRKILEDLGLQVVFSRYTFTMWGRFAWDIEFFVRENPRLGWLNIMLMPFYKFLLLLDLWIPLGTGNNLIITKKL